MGVRELTPIGIALIAAIAVAGLFAFALHILKEPETQSQPQQGGYMRYHRLQEGQTTLDYNTLSALTAELGYPQPPVGTKFQIVKDSDAESTGFDVEIGHDGAYYYKDPYGGGTRVEVSGLAAQIDYLEEVDLIQ